MSALRQPWFLVAAALFALHQLAEKGLDLHWPPADDYLDPLLCAPLLLSGLLAERRGLFGRGPGYVLPTAEVAVAVLLLAAISEGLFPYFSSRFTSDPWDVAAIIAGGFLFQFLLNRPGK